MTMIERLARILDPQVWNDDLPVPTRADVQSFHQRRQESCAKAKELIETMLAPTKGMVEAGGTANYGHPRETAVEWAKEDKWDSYAHEAVFLYNAMIGAALQEGNGTANG
jgi:hypothetical protein